MAVANIHEHPLNIHSPSDIRTALQAACSLSFASFFSNIHDLCRERLRSTFDCAVDVNNITADGWRQGGGENVRI